MDAVCCAQRRQPLAPCVAVIDDDRAFLRLMGFVLTTEGYAVHLFHAGAADFPAVKQLQPDALILDLRLGQPEKGWLVLDRVRADTTLAHTPVIICSADVLSLRDHAASRRRLDYAALAKPIDLDNLLSLLQRLVGRPPTCRAYAHYA